MPVHYVRVLAIACRSTVFWTNKIFIINNIETFQLQHPTAKSYAWPRFQADSAGSARRGDSTSKPVRLLGPGGYPDGISRVPKLIGSSISGRRSRRPDCSRSSDTVRAAPLQTDSADGPVTAAGAGAASIVREYGFGGAAKAAAECKYTVKSTKHLTCFLAG